MHKPQAGIQVLADRKALESVKHQKIPQGFNNIKSTNLVILQEAAFHLHPTLAGDLEQRELIRLISTEMSSFRAEMSLTCTCSDSMWFFISDFGMESLQ